MKRVYTLIIAVFAMFAVSANAQKAPSNCITIDPVDFLVSKALNATYEMKMGSANSLTLSGSYYKYSEWWSGYGIGASYRWYFDLFKEGKKALEGFSAGPCARMSWWSWDGAGSINDGGTYIAIGGEAAYKWIFSGGWTIEPIVRLTFGVAEVSGLGYGGWGTGVNFGYSW